MMGEEENLLREFLVGCLCDDTRYDRYLHFQVSDVLPIQNLMENMVWSLLNEQPGKRSINQATMGLVLLHLMHYTGRLRMSPDSGQSLEQKLTFQVLRYIEEHYREGTLAELAGIMGYDVYCLSRMIKQVLGRNYKELLQVKRLKPGRIPAAEYRDEHCGYQRGCGGMTIPATSTAYSRDITVSPPGNTG